VRVSALWNLKETATYQSEPDIILVNNKLSFAIITRKNDIDKLLDLGNRQPIPWVQGPKLLFEERQKLDGESFSCTSWQVVAIPFLLIVAAVVLLGASGGVLDDLALRDFDWDLGRI
jgi:hypothetical protein